MNTIILFYKYIDLANLNRLVNWQKTVCKSLNLKGRVILSQEGINGNLGGTPENIMKYIQQMQEHQLFSDIDFKQTDLADNHFPRLRVILKKEIVNMGIEPSLLKAKDGGFHLEPAQAHALIAAKPKDLVIFDARNEFEYAIGRFENALKAPIAHFRDFPEYIDKNLDQFKDKDVLMYCTGGVRCERATAYLKTKAVAKNIYQLKGGIHRYIEQFPQGFFKGKNYVFDGRMAVKATDDILGNCFICKISCDTYTNCLRASCNRHFISCDSCITHYGNTCSLECKKLLDSGTASARPMPKKVYTDDTLNIQQ